MKLPTTSTFQGRLRYARILRGFTQVALAGRLVPDVHPLTVSKWESGASDPRNGRLASIAKALRVSLRWLASGKGKPPTY